MENSGAKLIRLGTVETPAQRRSHTLILCVFFAIAILQVAPAMAHWFERQLHGRDLPFPVWVPLAVTIAILELGSGLSFNRVVDWSALWVLALLTLAVAMIYAFLVAILFLNPFGVVPALLDLQANRTAMGVCLLISATHGLFAWRVGRLSHRWKPTATSLQH